MTILGKYLEEHPDETLASLSRRLKINASTLGRWRRRDPKGPTRALLARALYPARAVVDDRIQGWR